MEDRGSGLLAEVIVLVTLSTLALIFRFWSRAITDNYYWWDDWFALATLPCFLGMSAIVLIWKNHAGLGKHADVLTSDQTVHGFQLLFALFWFYNFALTLPKLSVLFFYARVFEPYRSRWLRYGSYAAGTLVLARLLEGIISSLIQCSPIAKIWDSSIPGTCINENQSFIASGVLDVVPDMIILILPLPIIWKARSKLYKKITLSMLFICGYSVFAISLVLVIFFAVQGATLWNDFSWNAVPRIIIVLLEPSGSLVSICLPALLLLIKRVKTQGFVKLFVRNPHVDESTDEYRTSSGPFTSGSRVGRFERVRVGSTAVEPDRALAPVLHVDPEAGPVAVKERPGDPH